MNFTILITGLGYIVSSILCLLIAGIVWKRRNNPGSIPFVLTMLAFAVWCISRFPGLFISDIDQSIFWGFVAFISQIIIAPLLSTFIARYTKVNLSLNNHFYWVIWIVPLVLFVFVATNQWHGLAYPYIAFHDVNMDLVVIHEPGFLFYFFVIYAYTLILFSLFWFIRYLKQFGKKGILSTVLLIISSLTTFSLNLIYVLFPSLLLSMDFTPLSFSLLTMVLFWSISQDQLFNIKPIAYQTIFENAPDGMIVITNEGGIIEVNSAAENILGINQAKMIGESLSHLAPHICKIDLQNHQCKEQLETEIELPGTPQRIIRLRMQPVTNKNNHSIGRIITLHDISALKQAEEELKKKYQFTDTLVDATAEINATLELKEVLDTILENAAKVIPFDEADIILINQQGKYEFASVKSNDESHPMDFLFNLDPMSGNLFGFEKMVKTGKPIIINNRNDNPDWNPSINGSEWIQSYLGVPIQHQGKVLGFINLSMGTKNAYNDEQARQIEIFANYAASAIANAEYFNKTQHFANEMAALNEISQSINAGTGLEETLKAALRQLKSIIPIDAFGITLYEHQSHIIETYLYYEDETIINIPPFNLYEKDSVSRYVIEKEDKLYVPNVFANDSEINANGISWINAFHSHTLLAMPLIRRGEIFGVMIAGSNIIDAYNSDQIELVETIALQSSASIDNARLFELVQEQAITDDLTGLDNRRHFNLMLNKEMARAQRYNRSLSLIMLDIDDFKDVNDQYGHLAGDFLLKELALLTKECLRKADTAFRYGGEEFIFLLPETSADAAEEIAERMRKRIEETQFIYEAVVLNTTVSLGVCGFKSKSLNRDVLLNTVDKALYKAKAAGKNCVRRCEG